MNNKDFQQLIFSIIDKCVILKNRYVAEKELDIDYICLFSHSADEYGEFLNQAKLLGTIVDQTKTGPVFKLNVPLPISMKQPKVLKVRMPDPTKQQLGDVDFNTDYPHFKKTYLGRKDFALIQRETFEMMELNDQDSDVLVYFSSTPPSKLLGI